MKFYNAPYTTDKKYYLNLMNKLSELQKETGIRKNIFITFSTTYGVNENKYSKELVQNDLDMDDLFIE